MNFGCGEKVEALLAELQRFMTDHVYPNQKAWRAHTESEQRWRPVPIIDELKLKARAAGLWNLWRPKSLGGALSNTEYAPLCEVMGRVHWAPEVFNCSAPDTGNMETLLRFGTAEQIDTWCEPLLEGKIRSAFLMTEPDVASSDATNIKTSIVRDGGDYVIKGHKWPAHCVSPMVPTRCIAIRSRDSSLAGGRSRPAMPPAWSSEARK